MLTFGVLFFFIIGTGLLGKLVAAGFIPNEDQGTIYANILTPAGATLERTEKISDEIQSVARKIEGVESVSTLAGYSVLSEGVGASYGMNLISLKKWDEREHSDKEIIEQLNAKSAHIKDAKIEFFTPPPVPGYGNSSGFELRLLDKTGKGDLKSLEKVSMMHGRSRHR